ncbi:class I SAM-dependent methyltransferase [Ideonella sp. BN130291]|uniref:class I SAM-dependent methyltransferase n=1 Tax=Ideonella sp. BN130291 TaxID=3112940 RepID=UPI002E25DD06|nr:class I SAM-dependent methyltransferase [Ideonella sp. BN130291]
MNTITTTPDTWQAGDAYERYMGRWSRQLTPLFLQWLAVPAGRHWLDVGCGTGSLCAAILERAAPASVTGVEPSEGFLATARATLPPEVVLHQGTAARLPLPDHTVDVTVSALVLNFVPDPHAALRDMARVTVPGGDIAACVWDYAGCMAMTRLYWDAAAELGLLAPGQAQGERFPLCQPDALAAAFAAAGMAQVEVSGIDISMRFTSFDDYWQPFLAGQGPAPAHAMRLEAPARDSLRELLRRRLPMQPDGAALLPARAWAARGIVTG